MIGFKPYATSANIVMVPCKRTQHVGPNNVACCWPTMLRPFGWTLTVIPRTPVRSIVFEVIHVFVFLYERQGALSLIYCNFGHKMFLICSYFYERFEMKKKQESETPRTIHASSGTMIWKYMRNRCVLHCIAKINFVFQLSFYLRLPFTLNGVFSFPYVTPLIHMDTHKPLYQWKAYKII